MVISEYIYDENKTQKEGYLSKKRAVIVMKTLKYGRKKSDKQGITKTKTETISDNIYGNALGFIGAHISKEG